MVKGISRQVIVVHSPDPNLFEQAIFIIKDSALKDSGVTDDALMKEAKRLIRASSGRKQRKLVFYGPAWACAGALITGLAWVATILF